MAGICRDVFVERPDQAQDVSKAGLSSQDRRPAGRCTWHLGEPDLTTAETQPS